MIAMIAAVVVFFLVSQGGSFLGGQPGPANDPVPQNEEGGAQQSEAAPAQGGLIEQVQQGGLDPLENESDVVADAMFEPVEVNGVRWTIYEAADMGDTLFDGSLVSQNGTFVAVAYQVENLTSDPLTLVGLELVDSQDELYRYSSEAIPLLDGDGCETETLEPNTALECTAIYDVFEDAENLHVVVTDLNLLGGEQKSIDLQLD